MTNRKPIVMSLSEAWRIFHPELLAVTVETWTENDYEDEPAWRQLAREVEAGLQTPDVLSEIESCLDRSWCVGKVKVAALVVLAAHNRLEPFDPAASYSRRPRTQLVNGVRYIV